MKLHWILPSTVLGLLMLSSPADAARLQSWRFDPDNNRLEIQTDSAVQPKAQLVYNPTRLIIDLPGTSLGRPMVTQQQTGAINSIRVGQFDKKTTRIVVELKPGFTLDPKEVRVRGVTANKWTVQLPIPELVNSDSSPRTAYSISSSVANNNTVVNTTSGTTQIEGVQVTADGLFVRTNGGGNPEIRVNRSRDRTSITFDIRNANISPSLRQRDVAINQYGVSRIQFTSVQNSPPVVRMTLRTNKTSPDWEATVSNFGGIVVLPVGGVGRLPTTNNSRPVVTTRPTPRPSAPVNVSDNSSFNSSLAVIESVELGGGGSQLVIRGNQRLTFTNGWDRSTGLFRITIPNAQLARSVRGPSLEANSPVLRVRLQQLDARTVVIFVQPASGVQIGELNQLSPQLISLQLQRARPIVPPISSNPFPEPPSNQFPTPSPMPRVNGRVLVMIDPGHGGKDPGAIGIRGLREVDVVLPVSLRLAQILQAQGVQVMLTRNADYFVDLVPRVEMTKRAGADLFVSIHANAVAGRRPEVNGFEIYHFDRGKVLAQYIHRSYLQSISIPDRGVRRARFLVIRRNPVPAVLVELGFVTGRQDNALMRRADFTEEAAQAIARGILQYIQRGQ